jgi:hypothetical protein
MGAIGVAGPRGVGKTTLISSFAVDKRRFPGPLQVVVSAPVHYQPTEFMLHLFATICREVLNRQQPPRQRLPVIQRRATRLIVLPVAAVLAALPVTGFGLFDMWDSRLLPAAVLALVFLADLVIGTTRWVIRRFRIDDDPTVEELAKRHLDDIKYLRTHTSGWSGKVSLAPQAEAGWGKSVQREQRPQTYPELVTALRSFLAVYAARYRTMPAAVVAVDELDKIAAAERAQDFINEIKSIFGAPGTQFLVSVSEDALAAFERRGLPVRDAFDSAFDEIVRVDHLALADTAELVKSRVIGLPEPFMWLTHCMTGGLPRDVQRTARTMIALTEDGDAPLHIDEVCAALIDDDLKRKAHAFQLACREADDAPVITTFIRNLRRLRADGALLLAIAPDLRIDGKLSALGGQASTYVYFSATLLEVFRPDRVGQESPETFETLAQAKQSLGIHPRLAWLLVDEFREAWGLATIPVD